MRAASRTLRILPAALAAVLAAALAPAAAAQPTAEPAESLVAGTRVRVRLMDPPPTFVIGPLVRADRDSLVVADEGRSGARAFGWSEVRRLDRSDGHRSRGRAAAVGAGQGLIVGAAVTALAAGLTVATESSWPCGRGCGPVPPGFAVILLGVPFTAGTTAVGAALGARHTERWTRVEKPGLLPRVWR